MNVLSREKRINLVRLLVEGNSLRSCNRITGIARNTISSFLLEFGGACNRFFRRKMILLKCRHLMLDEIWTYCHTKQRNLKIIQEKSLTVGDMYVYTAQDEDSRAIMSFHVGKRDMWNTSIFVKDVANRIVNRPMISSDGWKPYIQAIEDEFAGDVEFGQVVKNFSKDKTDEAKVELNVISGDMSQDQIMTSLVERNNGSIRNFLRARMGRRTYAFTKCLRHLTAAMAMHFVRFNWCWRPGRARVTPAMSIGVTDRLLSIEDMYDAVLPE